MGQIIWRYINFHPKGRGYRVNIAYMLMEHKNGIKIYGSLFGYEGGGCYSDENFILKYDNKDKLVARWCAPEYPSVWSQSEDPEESDKRFCTFKVTKAEEKLLGETEFAIGETLNGDEDEKFIEEHPSKKWLDIINREGERIGTKEDPVIVYYDSDYYDLIIPDLQKIWGLSYGF